MTLTEAEEIVRAYGRAMAAGTVDGTRRDPRLLPTSPKRILTAIKLFIAFLIQNRSHTREKIVPLIQTASAIDSFRTTPQTPIEFGKAMLERQAEIDVFFTTVSRFAPDDPLFWQRVYTELGLAYDERKVSYGDIFKSRFQ